MPKVWPEEYDVHVTITTHHYIRVRVPEDQRPTGDSTAMAAVRRMDPLEIRRTTKPTGTSAYVMGSTPVENVTPQ